MVTDRVTLTGGTAAGSRSGDQRSTLAGLQTIVIVNGSDAGLHLLQTVVDAGSYDVVFVESTEHAYSQVKRIQPSLVLLCTSLEAAAGFHVLSMLKLDPETRGIPVLTYATDGRNDDRDAGDALPDDDVTAAVRAERMN